MLKTPSLVAALLIALPALLSGPSNALASPSTDITGALPNLSQSSIDGLRSALNALDSKNLAGALSIAANLPEIDRDIVTWMAIRRGVEGLTPASITDFARRRPDWPSVELMRRRAEQALSDMNLSPTDEIAAGIEMAVAKRCFVMAKKAGATDSITLTGGCAKNAGLKQAIDTSADDRHPGRTGINPLSREGQ